MKLVGMFGVWVKLTGDRIQKGANKGGKQDRNEHARPLGRAVYGQAEEIEGLEAESAPIKLRPR